MKKLPIVLNAVLLIAVVILYVLHFSGNSAKTETTAPKEIKSAAPVGEITAVYLNLDTLLNNLDEYYDLRNDLMSKQKQSQVQLENQAQNFESSVKDLQDKMNKGLITSSNANKKQGELQQEQERIIQLREQMTYQLAEEEQVMNRVIMDRIMSYLEVYNADKNYQMIISNVYGGTLLYANDNLNITQDIINGLNEKYQANKK